MVKSFGELFLKDWNLKKKNAAHGCCKIEVFVEDIYLTHHL